MNAVSGELYNLKTMPGGYRMVKFDKHLEIEAVYEIQHRRGRFYCECPQGAKSSTCKHREMIPIFARKRAVNTGRFYCHDTGEWTIMKEYEK